MLMIWFDLIFLVFLFVSWVHSVQVTKLMPCSQIYLLKSHKNVVVRIVLKKYYNELIENKEVFQFFISQEIDINKYYSVQYYLPLYAFTCIQSDIQLLKNSYIEIIKTCYILHTNLVCKIENLEDRLIQCQTHKIHKISVIII